MRKRNKNKNQFRVRSLAFHLAFLPAWDFRALHFIYLVSDTDRTHVASIKLSSAIHRQLNLDAMINKIGILWKFHRIEQLTLLMIRSRDIQLGSCSVPLRYKFVTFLDLKTQIQRKIRGIRVVVHTDYKLWCKTNCAEFSDQNYKQLIKTAIGVTIKHENSHQASVFRPDYNSHTNDHEIFLNDFPTRPGDLRNSQLSS